ncbi:MAG: MBL fold metallo-hydrolase, partial [Clostridiales bacterium]|nr:MBL fold metallo-hydrolase [Clostridiales bacterium]
MIIKQFISMFIGTNVYIAVDENTKKAFLVDPADPNPKAAQFLQENGYELEYIILTHGHGDHIGGIAFMSKKSNLARMNKKLPVLFFSGDQDPVGDFGKGVIRSYMGFLKAGMEDVTL